jgi:hypothetical protein
MIIDTLPPVLKSKQAVSWVGLRMGIINMKTLIDEKRSTDNIRKLLKEVSSM